VTRVELFRKSERAMKALLQMRKLDIKKLKEAVKRKEQE